MESQTAAQAAPPGSSAPPSSAVPEERLIRIEEVERLTGLKKSAIYAGMVDQSFPKNVLIGSRSVAWKLSEVRQWIADRPTAKRPAIA